MKYKIVFYVDGGYEDAISTEVVIQSPSIGHQLLNDKTVKINNIVVTVPETIESVTEIDEEKEALEMMEAVARRMTNEELEAVANNATLICESVRAERDRRAGKIANKKTRKTK